MTEGAEVLLVQALEAIVAAIRDEREARTSGEYSDGLIWSADIAVARLRVVLEVAHTDE